MTDDTLAPSLQDRPTSDFPPAVQAPEVTTIPTGDAVSVIQAGGTTINPAPRSILNLAAGVGVTLTGTDSVTGQSVTVTITNAAVDVITTAGDLLYGSAADTIARLGIGSAGQYLKVVSGLPAWATLSTALTSTSNALSGDVTLTNANQFYDGPSISCAAGTWFLAGTVTVRGAQGAANELVAQLWDGTTAVSSAQQHVASGGFVAALPVCGVVSPGSTTTYKISVASDTNAAVAGKILAAASVNSAGNTASFLFGVKIA